MADRAQPCLCRRALEFETQSVVTHADVPANGGDLASFLGGLGSYPVVDRGGFKSDAALPGPGVQQEKQRKAVRPARNCNADARLPGEENIRSL